MRRCFPTFILAFALPLTLACGTRAPARPAQVPADAAWVGGRGRGAFLLIGEREGNRWRIKVWSPEGALLADAPFVLRGMARTGIEPHELAAWDGRHIALKDGTLLVPSQ